MIAELWRSMRAFFGVRYVTLYADPYGSPEVRPVFFRGGHPCADYVGWGIRVVRLLDGGGIASGSYVRSWEPYEPSLFGPLRWPVYAPSQEIKE